MKTLLALGGEEAMKKMRVGGCTEIEYVDGEDIEIVSFTLLVQIDNMLYRPLGRVEGVPDGIRT